MEKTTHLLLTAIGAALDAGREILDVYRQPDTGWEVEQKADHSPLTLADRRAHAAIAARLAGTGLPVLSEEGRHASFAERKAWKRLWIVDPLDGTKEFIKRNGEFTVNIALVEDGTPQGGVVYVPVTHTLYFGAAGHGAYIYKECPETLPGTWEALAKEAEALPQPGKREGFVVVASRSHRSPETEAFIEELRKEHPDLSLRSAGSSLKICLVAAGQADVYPRLAPTMEWDTAAGDAVARAAGGQVVTADSREPLVYNKEELLNPWFIVFSK